MSQEPNCYHCGEPCQEEILEFDNNQFCCNGCQTVYELLNQNDLCDYYRLEQMPGISPKAAKQNKFAYLENETILEQLLDFQDEKIAKVTLYLPQIHCSSCLWLLENLYKLQANITQSRVNFLKKEVSFTYLHQELSLRALVELLTSLGYEPEINLDQTDQKKRKTISRKLVYQVGLAGFAFGNIMLLSLPEYFGLDIESYREFSSWFGYLNLIIATPVAFYSGADYFKSAWVSLQKKRLNIDVPIALGVLVLYLRSGYEVVSQTGAGYFDSLCGLLFFLLLGRIFQEKTYHRLSFERDFKSYFPISVTKLNEGIETSIPVNEVVKGDRLLIHHGELIPVDAILLKGEGRIDNSFATGESKPIKKHSGDRIYAGGKQQGGAIEIEAIKPLSQSKLTSLWNDQFTTEEDHTHFSKITDRISQWFTPIILVIATLAGIFQWSNGISIVIQVVSAVLIVACPCALALAAPFTFGHASRWLGRKNCYLRNANVVENIADVNHLIFDKTGTLTYSKNQTIEYIGHELSINHLAAIKTIFRQSNHPLSRALYDYLPKSSILTMCTFEEIAGKGLQSKIGAHTYQLGSPKWLKSAVENKEETAVVVAIDKEIKGYFTIKNDYRDGLKPLMNQLSKTHSLSLLSGDNDNQKEVLSEIFPKGSNLLFNQTPQDKMNVVEELQQNGDLVMMVGDGLNDAGALKKSDVGVSLAEDVNAFSPACDMILAAEQFSQLDKFIAFAKACKQIVIVSFVISFLYNSIGIFLAVQGLLSPVAAAILMPVSSISVVGFSTFATWMASKKIQ